MSDVQREVAKLHHELERLEKIAYETYCDLKVAIDALKQIRDGKTTTKEMIGTATWALNIIQKIADSPSEPYTLNN